MSEKNNLIVEAPSTIIRKERAENFKNYNNSLILDMKNDLFNKIETDEKASQEYQLHVQAYNTILNAYKVGTFIDYNTDHHIFNFITRYCYIHNERMKVISNNTFESLRCKEFHMLYTRLCEIIKYM